MRGKIEIVVAAVPDPNPIEGERLKRQKAAVNIAGNPLEREYSRGRISTEAYQAGLTFERILEAARIGGGAVSIEPSAGAGDHEAVIARAIDRAAAAVAACRDVRSKCGQRGALILRAVLGDRQTFVQIAVSEGLGRDRGTRKIAAEFREALEALAVVAKGKDRGALGHWGTDGYRPTIAD
ncbi:hypothetical protein [Methylosinus sp. Ce-a6]|uniref:hypothetical protein n=1 Tax=Methylosinus sp. Ce-a6 TaxID=2172005 RepID=UPI001358DDCD|nr:hypothetical protein [Methylosinus sp. Ce-a6]